MPSCSATDAVSDPLCDVMSRRGGRVGRARPRVAAAVAAVAGVGAVAGLGYALPSVAALRGVRARVAPTLAGVGDADHVALTFDDGPDPASTPQFLDVLEALEVHATFFVLGGQASRATGLAADMAAAGHELAVHGWDHRPMLLRGPRSTYEQLARTRELIAAATGRLPRFVRPPNGILTAAVLVAARRLDLTPVLWTACGRDWTATATPRTVLDAVTPDLRGGATVLLHDSDRTSAPGAWRSALGALPELAARCADAGLRLGPLVEHGLVGSARG
jgi:peptidoglycan/xylan/chitin deacetylase (PgdA/CDA1 family)